MSRFRTSVPKSEPEARRWLERLEPDRRAGRRLELALATGPRAAAAGSFALRDLGHADAELNWWLAVEARGRGLATRASVLLAAWAFRELGLARLTVEIEPENAASQRVAERCGFLLEGRLRSKWELADGRRVDSLVYGLLAGELRRS